MNNWVVKHNILHSAPAHHTELIVRNVPQPVYLGRCMAGCYLLEGIHVEV